MFGMGFTEILLIAVIAILFLGPDKLPSAMVDIAKFFRGAKNAISSVQNSFEEEMHVSDIKKEALAYKEQLLNATDVKRHVGAGFESIIADIENEDVVANTKSDAPKEVTFKKKNNKKKKEEVTDV